MTFFKPVSKIIKSLSPFFRKAGINPKHLEAILKVKLTMDGRKNQAFNANKKKRNPMVAQTIFNLIFGIFLGIIIIEKNIEPEIRFLFLHSSMLLIFTIMIISEFSTILFDTRDNTEILPRPINSKTYYASKIIHIIIYLLYIGIPLSLGAVVTTTIMFGVFDTLILVVLILFDILIAVFLSNLFYMGIIKFFSAKKIKDIVLYLQVVLAIGVYGGYQFLPRLFESKVLTEASLPHAWWIYLIPTVWPAKVSALFAEGNFSEMFSFIALNIAVPLLGLLAIIKYFAPLYNQKLSQLDVETKDKKKEKHLRKRRGSLVNILPLSSKEKATYRLIAKNVMGDRKFKAGVYSLLGYFAVIIVLPIISDFDNPSEILPKLIDSKKYFLLLYFPVFISYITILQVQYSEQPGASWLFRFLPYDKPGQIIYSGFLFVILRFMLPMMIITNTIVLLIWGTGVFPQVILSWALSLAAMILIVMISDKYLPISRSRTMQDSAKNFLSLFYIFILAGVLFGITIGCSYLPSWGILLVSLLVFVLFLFLSQKVRRYSWQKIDF